MDKNRKYDREFKLNAAKLYQQGSKSMSKLAHDLGIPMTTLATWIKQFQNEGDKSFPGSGVLKPCNTELYQLRKELADVKQERDILKKAVAIFSRVKA